LSTFVATARRAAASWRESTPTISDADRAAGIYRQGRARPYCLSHEARSFNLLPEARGHALERFSAADIPWHDGVNGQPSNHLLSSQVQCANALAPLVADPGALASIFGGMLSIDRVLPFHGTGPAATLFDWNDHVVFEWAGASDYLGERANTPRARGEHTTSADAAIRYRATDGSVWIALVEWKYTENYRDRILKGGSAAMKARKLRYSQWWSPTGPIRIDQFGFENMLVEPLYQLFRQQCLAQEMQKGHEGEATKVTVVFAAPAGNHDLLDFFPAPDGSTLIEGAGALLSTWSDLLHQPDGFRYLDTESLLSPQSVVSDEYRHRYGSNAEHSAAT
jgi:hypothetical protein